MDKTLGNIDKMSEEITARFGYSGDPVGAVETINSDFDGLDKLDGERLVHQLNLDMDEQSVRTRIGNMRSDLMDQLYTEN